MTDHNHILQRASLPGDCPACDVVWFAVEIMDPLIHFETEFQVAETLREDYGDREFYYHLTAIMWKGQKLLHHNGSPYYGDGRKGAIQEWLSARRS